MLTKKQLTALLNKWERILEKEGLGDIDFRNGQKLRVYHGQRIFPKHNPWSDPVKTEAKETYYQLAGEFLNEHRFESEKERKIWELHSQGIPVREIARRVHQPRNWSQINKKIIRLRRMMLKNSSQ